MEFIHQFFHGIQPVFLEFPVPGQPLGHFSGIPGLDMFLVCMVKILILRIVTVIRNSFIRAVAVRAFIYIPPGKGSPQMLRQSKGHLIFISRRLPQGADILSRPDIDRIKAINL